MIAKSPLATRSSIVVSLIVLLCGLLIAFLSVTRKEHVTGIVVPDSGLVRVMPPQQGTVSAKFVQNGDLVTEGQPLFRLQSDRATLLGNTQVLVKSSIEQRIAAIERDKTDLAEISRLQAKTLAARSGQLTAQLAQMDSELRLLNSRVEISEATLQRSNQLSQSGFLSSTQLQERQAELLDQKIRLESLRRARKSTEIEVLSLQGQLNELPTRLFRDTSTLERAKAELDAALAENESRTHLTVLAPVTGTVIATNFDVGLSLQPSSNPVSIVPSESKLVVDLFAPSRSVGFVRLGSPVLLRFTAFPYQKFGQQRGRVVEISAAPTQINDLPTGISDLGAQSEPVYRIRVALDKATVTAYGREEKLAVGMKVEASLVLESRKIYEWILDPIFSISGRIS